MSDTIVRCDLCLFFDPRRPDSEDLGICRRHSPRPNTTTAAALCEDMQTILWPMVTTSDYCGDGVLGETAEFPEDDPHPLRKVG